MRDNYLQVEAMKQNYIIVILYKNWLLTLYNLFHPIKSKAKLLGFSL